MVSIATDSRPLVVDPYAEMRIFSERLIAAETHCVGLVTTVRSYEREINKLRQIVSTLFEDFQILQSNIR